MLWTDGYFLTGDDLNLLDPEADAIAESLDVTLDADGGIIQQAIQECQMELQGWLASSVAGMSYGGIPANHLNIVMGQWANRLRISFSQIVVSGTYPGDWSVIRRWVGYRALSYLLRAASEQATVDRYETKYTRITRDIEITYEPMLFNAGINVVNEPLFCPGSREPGSGWWDATDISFVAGTGAETAQDVDVSISYVGPRYVTEATAQSINANAESARAKTAEVSIPAGNLIQVSIARLNPPTTNQPMATRVFGSFQPMAAVGWNVWIGQRGETPYLQNATPIPIATKTFTMPGEPVFSGYPGHDGQVPEGAAIMQRLLMRG